VVRGRAGGPRARGSAPHLAEIVVVVIIVPAAAAAAVVQVLAVVTAAAAVVQLGALLGRRGHHKGELAALHGGAQAAARPVIRLPLAAAACHDRVRHGGVHKEGGVVTTTLGAASGLLRAGGGGGRGAGGGRIAGHADVGVAGAGGRWRGPQAAPGARAAGRRGWRDHKLCAQPLLRPARGPQGWQMRMAACGAPEPSGGRWGLHACHPACY
jgi:hypothetical protein